jgi:hypothetical protein
VRSRARRDRKRPPDLTTVLRDLANRISLFAHERLRGARNARNGRGPRLHGSGTSRARHRFVADRPGGNPGNQDNRRQSGEPPGTTPGVRRSAKQSPYALEQRSARGGQHEPAGPVAQLFEAGERSRVGVRIAAQAHREIIAAVLALDPDSARYPPDRRMIEEQRLDERLQQVDDVVVPPDVRELVRENRLELVWRETGKRARRQQNDR